MVLMTMIARVADGLPLAATMQEDEQVFIKNILPLIGIKWIFFSLEGVFWTIKTKQKCYSEN